MQIKTETLTQDFLDSISATGLCWHVTAQLCIISKMAKVELLTWEHMCVSVYSALGSSATCFLDEAWRRGLNHVKINE